MHETTPPSGPPPDLGGFDRIVGRIAWACGVLSGACILAILALICAETVLRPLQASLLVTDEIAGYLNAAAVFLGLAWTLREGGFIRVEILYDRTTGRTRQAIRWLIVLTSAAFTAIVLWVCTRHVIHAWQRDTRAVSVIETPEWIPQSVMAVGFAVLLLQLLAWIVTRVRHIP